MKRTISCLLLGGVLFGASPAFADGAVIATSALKGGDTRALEGGIALARASDASSFAAVAALRAELIARDAHKRGRFASVTPALRGLGARALWPMLEELAVASIGKSDMAQTAWVAWRLDLLEALGALRDRRALAVLEAATAAEVDDPAVTTAAAQALGKLGTERAAKKLIALSGAAKKRRLAVLAGMGHCRRQIVAEHLGHALVGARDASEIRMLARSLGDVGNAWAWQTPIVRASGEESSVRATAADALVQAFRATTVDSVRAALTEALLVVDDASTRALIRDAKRGATPSQIAALDALLARIATSPLH